MITTNVYCEQAEVPNEWFNRRRAIGPACQKVKSWTGDFTFLIKRVIIDILILDVWTVVYIW